MSIDIHALSGAYAVDAVDEFERAQFERHLTGCATCRAEVDSLREAAGLLGEVSVLGPPASLRSSVLTATAGVRPLPPVVAAAADRGRSTRRRFPVLLAAAAAVIALGVGGTVAVTQPWNDDTTVAQAGDREQFSTELASGGTMTVQHSAELNQATVTTEGLPKLDDDQTYELWLIHDGEFRKAGLMDGDATQVLLDGDVNSASGVGITIEPDGGSEIPTGDPVGQLDFERT